MIFGIGTDIVEVNRIENSLSQFGDAFAKRILHPDEMLEYEHSLLKSRFLAKRFAAKEAFSKALGTGLRAPVTFHNIVIAHDTLGKPVFVISKELQVLLDEKKIQKLHVTVSDEKNLAVAFVVLEV